MSIPVVFMHRGHSDYLNNSMWQAKQTNPVTEIILLGDDTNGGCNFVQHINVVHDPEAQQFAKIYQHMSPNGYEYELFCFQRWLILKNFMEQNKIERCFILDSDVLLYADINGPEFDQYRFALCWNNGGASFIDLEILNHFCNYLLLYYSHPVLRQKLVQQYQQNMKQYQCGISDMTLLTYFKADYPQLVQDTANINDNHVFDTNINICAGWECRQNKKKIYFIGQVPFCWSPLLTRYVRFCSLHFQGTSKSYIPFFMSDYPRASSCVFDYQACRWEETADICNCKIKQL